MAEWLPPAGFDRALKRAFGAKAWAIPNAPALTGVRLWKLTRDPADYPVLPDDVRALLHTGQGRWEITTQPDAPPVAAIYEYDMRWAYIACTTGQVCGELIHDTEPTYERYLRGFYRIRFSPPADWSHVGLFAVPLPDGESWHCPTTGQHTCWAGWTEVILGHDYGWNIEILERILWRPVTGIPAPLDIWRNRLVQIAEREPDYRDAVRDIIIRTIGQFGAQYGRRERIRVARMADVPAAQVLTAEPDEDGGVTYTYRHPLRPELAAVQHPEWSADIWARCRTRLLRYQTKRRGVVVAETGALTLPRERVLAFRQDALWLAVQPAWADGGEIGDFRLHRVLAGPVCPPRTTRELIRLQQQMH